jgi:hypothetical protein
MSQIFSLSVKSTLEFPAIKENAQAARSSAACDDVMSVALIVFSVLSTLAFVSCLIAAVVISNVALGASAGVIALLALSLLMPIICIDRADSGESVDDEVCNATPYSMPPTPHSPYTAHDGEGRHSAKFATPEPLQASRLNSIRQKLDFDNVPDDAAIQIFPMSPSIPPSITSAPAPQVAATTTIDNHVIPGQRGRPLVNTKSVPPVAGTLTFGNHVVPGQRNMFSRSSEAFGGWNGTATMGNHVVPGQRNMFSRSSEAFGGWNGTATMGNHVVPGQRDVFSMNTSEFERGSFGNHVTPGSRS